MPRYYSIAKIGNDLLTRNPPVRASLAVRALQSNHAD
jgi:hypothetical protein